MKLHVATYNIHKGVSWFAQQPRIHDMRDALTLLNADLLFLQEVQGQDDQRVSRDGNWPKVGQHEFLAGDLHQSAYGMNAIYDHGHHGNAMLSRYPIIHNQNQDVSDHRFEERGILHCIVQLPEHQLHCYVVHLGLFAGSRRRQTELLIQAVRADTPADAPLIIAGDFNDWQTRLSDPLQKALGVTEVFEHRSRPGAPQAARTFPVGFPMLTLDRIYVRGLRVDHAEVLQGKPWQSLSDHAPLCATLTL